MNVKVLFPTVLLTAAFTSPAFAYLDPGTGSMVLQAILGVVAIAGATVSVYWQRVRSFFSSFGNKKK